MRRISKINLLVIFGMVIILLSFLFNLQNIIRPEGEPFFHIRILPITYWVGFVFSLVLFSLYLSSYVRNIKLIKYKSLFIVILIFIFILIYILPKLVYTNKIYTDTYLFVGEILHVLQSGNIGFGWSYESPGLSIFVSSLSLISGTNYILLSEVLPLLLPFIYFLFIFLNARIFTNEYSSYITVSIFLALNWFGFLFNRQSFSLILQLLTFLCIFKVLLIEKTGNSNYILMAISYFALMFSHPASPLVVSLNVMSISILIFIINIFKQQFKVDTNDIENYKKIAYKGLSISIIFFIFWIAWQTYVHGSVYVAYQNLLLALREFSILPNPSIQIAELISFYTSEYKPIINYRLFQALFITFTGVIISLYLIFRELNIKRIILSSWFLSTNVLLIYVLYAHSWLYRPIFYSLPVFSIMLTMFFTTKKLENTSYFNPLHILKYGLALFIIIFITTIPLTMYAHSPFMYPPTSYLHEVDFMTSHLSGLSMIFEGGSEFRYFSYKNNASILYLKLPYYYDFESGLQIDKLYDVKGIGTSFRLYIKEGFVTSRLPEIYLEVEEAMLILPQFGRIYNSDLWHTIYVNIYD